MSKKHLHGANFCPNESHGNDYRETGKKMGEKTRIDPINLHWPA